PKLYPTTITITLQGQPLADAAVLLTPLDTENHWVHGSRTNQQGTATILTHGQYNGVPLGKYKLRVSKTVVEGDPPPSDIELAENPNRPKSPPQKYFHEIPPEYNDPNTTPFELEIKTTANHFMFDISKRVKIEIPRGGVTH
ncbi:MAG: carboxypeptidase-like regulatory domain-containing protein, partial [Planctomycetaceae bacterium]|nr:carboxypeptidase-like regulatory domain-containing protein [Planctomycetaceae bacterium]